jgi:predicted N-formylglutamate amidohydrolase
MHNPSIPSLLIASDPHPVQTINSGGASPFLLIGDHAGNILPTALQPFGVGPADMTRHIAWDIGVAGLGAALSAELDAMFIRQTYSRLVIDCNRDPVAVDAMPAISDGTVVPGNQDLSPADRAARVAAIHTPYQAAIAAELARRDATSTETILVSLHSFTPSMRGFDRPWQIGILHHAGDARFARAMLQVLKTETDLCVGDNEPYAMDGIDYTVPLHAFAARRRYVEIEIRQDLLASPQQQATWAKTLAPLLRRALDQGEAR